MNDSTHSGSTLRATSPPRDAGAVPELSTSGLDDVVCSTTMPAADAQQVRAQSPASGCMDTEAQSRSQASCAESVDVLWTSPVAAEAAAAAAGTSSMLYQRQGTDESLLADNGPSKARARYGSDQWSTASAI